MNSRAWGFNNTDLPALAAVQPSQLVDLWKPQILTEQPKLRPIGGNLVQTRQRFQILQDFG